MAETTDWHKVAQMYRSMLYDVPAYRLDLIEQRHTISGSSDGPVADSPPTIASEVRPESSGEAAVAASADEPPHPAAGVRADTSGGTPTNADSGKPRPATKCPTFHSEHGACQRTEGHDGSHQSKSNETWA